MKYVDVDDRVKYIYNLLNYLFTFKSRKHNEYEDKVIRDFATVETSL